MNTPDTVLETLLELKESTGRIEQKVDSLSTHEARISEIENQISTVKGLILIAGLAWSFLLAWVSGMGNYIHIHIAYLMNTDV